MVSITGFETAFGAGAGFALDCSFGAAMARCRGVFLMVGLGAGLTSAFGTTLPVAAALISSLALAGFDTAAARAFFGVVIGFSFLSIGVATFFIRSDFGFTALGEARLGFIRELFSDNLNFGDFVIEDFHSQCIEVAGTY